MILVGSVLKRYKDNSNYDIEMEGQHRQIMKRMRIENLANFPDKMKLGNITPVFKKKRPFKKGKLDQAKANRRLRGKFFVHILIWL